ncbi:MAG: GDSL-type esterase/lipase family protein [Porphyromonas sp.]|nr:GDSL-type esterase/lipase family protein [Porphyromonas sp.]
MNKDKNYQFRVFALLWVLLGALVGLYFLPEKIGNWTLKPVDILSDLRDESLKDREETVEDGLIAEGDISPTQDGKAELLETHPDSETDFNNTDDLSSIDRNEDESEMSEDIFDESSSPSTRSTYDSLLRVANVDTSLTLIKDYTANRQGMKKFFTNLENRNALGRPVRIAVLGDSFIEGDIFTDALRNQLQSRYGGAGVGWLALTSQVAGFRASVRHEFGGWKTHSLLDKSPSRQTISGYYHTNSGGSPWVKYTLPKEAKPIQQSWLYYRSNDETQIQVSVGDSVSKRTLPSTAGIITAHLLYEGESRGVRLRVDAPNSSFASYGIALDGSSGISVDNFSLRGNSGIRILSVDSSTNREFTDARPYDLIILQYGLNVASAKQTNYSSYISQMRKVIRQIKRSNPGADILLMGVSDRGQRSSGGVASTMPGVIALHRAQEKLAQEEQISFYSLLNAMRELGGISKLASQGAAAKDYTHLSHKGGRLVATKFMEAFDLEQKYYDKIKQERSYPSASSLLWDMGSASTD